MTVEAERILRDRAADHAHHRRWADALVHWELLVLLKPESDEYRGQVERARAIIGQSVERSLALAEHARRSGNFDRAVTEYLRVLSLDRQNARAAQALRDIERERTRRAYMNRPPRIIM